MTTFTPRRINAKASKAGKTYWEIETEQGNATCFDYPIVQEIEKSLGKPISLYDLEANDKGFINVRPAKKGFSQAPQSQISQPAIAQPTHNSENFKEARMAKDVSIYTSYAKDIFLALLEKEPKSDALDFIAMMKDAISVVKQAKTSFERSETYQDANPKVIETIQG